jgi:hypothetical protein
MTDVYQHASSVVVWLGLDEGNSRKATDSLNEIGAFINEIENASNSDADFSDWLYKTLSNKAYDSHWNGLRQILQRSYWSRLWVIQELVVTDRPDEVRLLCGFRKTRFTYLRNSPPLVRSDHC